MTALLRSFATDFDELVNVSGDRLALIDARYEREYTYQSLAELMVRCQSLFREHYVEPGDTILSLLPNSADGIIVFLASAKGGYSFAPLPAEAVGDEIVSAIRLVKPKLCFVSKTATETVSEAIRAMGVNVVRVALDGSLSWLPEEAAPTATAPVASTGRLYLSTSGSTGEPKAIVLDVDRLWSSGKAFTSRHRFLGVDSRFLNVLPISYLGGLFNLCLIPIATGGSFVVTEAFSGRSLLSFWQQIEQFDITVLWLVPSILRGLLAIAERTSRQKKFPPKSIRACFLGTAPIDLKTKLHFEEVFGIPLLENFALSETTFLTSEYLEGDISRDEASVGGILPYVMLRLYPISDGAEPSIAALAPTEIAVQTPFLFLGYLQADGSVQLPLDEDGYFRTGDIGHLAEGALLILDGRLRDVVKKGGFLVPLREIELLAERHGDVREAAAIAHPHEFYGESFDLQLILKDGRVASDVIPNFGAWLRERLVRYKWPDKIRVVDDFPRTASGKIAKGSIAVSKPPL